MVSHHPAMFGDHRHCGSGDIMVLVAEEENSRCSCFNLPLLFSPPLLFISKGQRLTAHGISYNSDPGHALKAAIGQNFENNFCQSVQKR